MSLPPGSTEWLGTAFLCKFVAVPSSWIKIIEDVTIYSSYQKFIIKDNWIIPNLFINGIEIERVKSFDFLEITLDENITWKPQIAAIANKLSKYAGIFNKLKNYLCAMISPHWLLTVAGAINQSSWGNGWVKYISSGGFTAQESKHLNRPHCQTVGWWWEVYTGRWMENKPGVQASTPAGPSLPHAFPSSVKCKACGQGLFNQGTQGDRTEIGHASFVALPCHQKYWRQLVACQVHGACMLLTTCSTCVP